MKQTVSLKQVFVDEMDRGHEVTIETILCYNTSSKEIKQILAIKVKENDNFHRGHNAGAVVSEFDSIAARFFVRI